MQVIEALKKYIHQVLGIEVSVVNWPRKKELPFFLRDRYDFYVLRLMGREELLMADCQKEETPPVTIRKHMEQIRKAWQGEVVYVREQVTGYNRTRLLQNQVPFIVPNNQLYLPMLAIDLREHFKTKRVEVKKLSPAAQVLVLQTIYKQSILFDEKRTMTDWAAELGYTKMTMTRAFRDLRMILEEEMHLEALRGRKLWDLVKPYLRSPVRCRKYYNIEQLNGFQQILSGDNALAHYTMMAEPNGMTVCMTGEEWQISQKEFLPEELAQQEPGSLSVEIWRYAPQRLARNGVADPLSLYLAYDKNIDERVEMALEELLEGIQW